MVVVAVEEDTVIGLDLPGACLFHKVGEDTEAEQGVAFFHHD